MCRMSHPISIIPDDRLRFHSDSDGKVIVEWAAIKRVAEPKEQQKKMQSLSIKDWDERNEPDQWDHENLLL